MGNEKKILEIAKEAIEAKLENREPKIGKIPAELKEKQGCFVTLTINGQLHGCIGHILPVQELYKDLIENACSAAFSDPRFMPLTKAEFEKVKIEVSLLDLPRKLNYKTTDELLNYLAKNKPGVIIKKGLNQATFLPQVWEELPQAEDFLSHLCLKAGLPADEWLATHSLSEEWTQGLDFETYGVKKIL